MGGIEAANHPDMTVADAVIVNTLYEMSAWCTSVITKLKDGSIIHARNLDFDFPDQMRKLTYKAKFVRGEKHVFDAVMFAGTVGMYTGIKSTGSYSISLNQRMPEEHEANLLYNILMSFVGFPEISWVIRQTLAECDTYECAYQRTKATTVNSKSYLIIAGTKDDEGVILSRDQFAVANEEFLNSSAGVWNLVVTNNDYWTEEGCYGRCAAARKYLSSIGQDEMNA